MANYTKQYATYQAFIDDMSDPTIGGTLARLLNTQPQTGAYSVAATVLIYSTGETYHVGTNVILDIKSVGPGDYVVYKDGRFYGVAQKWIDDNGPYQPTQKILQVKEAWLVSAGFTICGTVIKRFGNRIRLAGEDNETLPFTTTEQSDYDWDVPAVPHYPLQTVKRCGQHSTQYHSGNGYGLFQSRFSEYKGGENGTQYWPITRAAWNAAVAAGNATVTQNSKTATLADYNYDYDKFIAQNFVAMYPAPDGLICDSDGIGNTNKIVAAFIGKTDMNGNPITANSTTYAAGYCYNYSISGCPELSAHRWFLGTLKDLLEISVLRHTFRSPISWSASFGFWSSTFHNRGTGDGLISGLGVRGTIGQYYKYNATVNTIPLADIIEN